MTCTAACKAGAFVILAAVASRHANGAGQPAPLVVDVDVRGLAFNPTEAVARVGDTIRWINHDIVPHTVTSVPSADPGSRAESGLAIDSGLLSQGAVFETVVTDAGLLRYRCLFHPTMEGALRVVS